MLVPTMKVKIDNFSLITIYLTGSSNLIKLLQTQEHWKHKCQQGEVRYPTPMRTSKIPRTKLLI